MASPSWLTRSRGQSLATRIRCESAMAKTQAKRKAKAKAEAKAERPPRQIFGGTGKFLLKSMRPRRRKMQAKLTVISAAEAASARKERSAVVDLVSDSGREGSPEVERARPQEEASAPGGSPRRRRARPRVAAAGSSQQTLTSNEEQWVKWWEEDMEWEEKKRKEKEKEKEEKKEASRKREPAKGKKKKKGKA